MHIVGKQAGERVSKEREAFSGEAGSSAYHEDATSCLALSVIQLHGSSGSLTAAPFWGFYFIFAVLSLLFFNVIIFHEMLKTIHSGRRRKGDRMCQHFIITHYGSKGFFDEKMLPKVTFSSG